MTTLYTVHLFDRDGVHLGQIDTNDRDEAMEAMFRGNQNGKRASFIDRTLIPRTRS